MSTLKLFGFTAKEQQWLSQQAQAGRWEPGQVEELDTPRPAGEVWVVRVGDLSPEFVQAYGIKLSKDEMISFNVNRLLKGRRIVSYYIDTDKKAPADFSIVDTTGAGVFDTRYPAEKNIPAPAWAVAVCK